MGKTNIHHRSGFMRLLAALLCAVCVFGLVPTQAFALSPMPRYSTIRGTRGGCMPTGYACPPEATTR